MLVSTWFMASSTDFCSIDVDLMFNSVLFKDYLRLSNWADIFYSYALN